ncbi:MAG: Mut7-C RNAse domain-containing protein [Gammaproteobacteria bacterium]|nr:Mut7-C RNAse domain-containing protein [Gammaproteobacteria bacterium]
MISLTDQSNVPKILCDQSLEDSAHWLRAAGYDVQVPAAKLSDLQLYDIAQNEQRVLIINQDYVQDIPLESNSVLLVDSPLVFEQIKQIGKNLRIDWLYRPLSRCMLCNTELTDLNINKWIVLPQSMQNNTVTSHGCPSCKRIYWAGDEVNRMVFQLQSFKRLEW